MRLALFAPLFLFMVACSGATHDVAWRVRFLSGIPASAVVVHAEVREGTCMGTVRGAYDLDLSTTPPTATATAMAMSVGAGTYCLYAEARDLGCAVLATGSKTVSVPSATEFVVDLSDIPTGMVACGGMCAGGHCRGVDAGMDGGVRDANPTDMPGVDLGDAGPVDLGLADLGDAGPIDLGLVDLALDGGCTLNGCRSPSTCQLDGTCLSPCPDGNACTSSGASGLCHADACCTGCWDGARCLGGLAVTSCGGGGNACTTCDPAAVPAMDCVERACAQRTDRFTLSPITSFLLMPVGRLFSAGDDTHQQRGDRATSAIAGSYEELTTGPADVVLAVGTTQFATCAIKFDASLWCWGTNSFGLLGTGMAMTMTTPTPTHVATELWAVIDGGSQHFCAIRADGGLYCWGDDANGALGLGGGTPGALRIVPTRVGTETWSAVSAGDVHTCAIRADGSLWCWGGNTHGQLGDGTTAAHATPQRVGTAADWRSVSVEGTHSCAIKTDRSLWCWGDSRFGQLGLGTPGGDISAPTQVGTATDWQSISAGQFHTCGIRLGAATHIYCWGFNGSGAVGDGSGSGEEDLPVDIPAPSSHWTNVTAGWQATCASTSTTEYCWGDDRTVRLGLGPLTMMSLTTPTPVSF